jgi:hypothetical protein
MNVWRAIARHAFLLGLAACGPPPASEPPLDHARPVQGSLDPRRFLNEAVVRAEAAGAQRFEALGAAVVSEGEQLGSFVEVPDDACVLVLARAGGGIRDVDLFAFADGGDQVTSDESPEAAASVLLCPPHPRRVYVAARVVNGTGVLAVGVLTVPTAAADAVAKAVGVRGRPGEDSGKLATWPGLERKVRERRAALGASWEDVRRAALPLDPGAATAVSSPVGPRRCLDVLVVPSDEVPLLEAQLLDASGRIVARGHPPGRDRAFVVCSEERQTVTVVIRPRLGSGLAAVIIGRSPEGAAAELVHRIELDGLEPLVPLDAAVARHDQRVAALALGRPTETRGEVHAGERLVVPLDLREGCSRIDAIGGQPLGSFAVELWSDDDRRLGASRGGELATVFACGPAQKARLEITADARGGPVAVAVRLDPKPAAALAAEPLAASRLLARLDAAAGPIAPSAAAAAEVLDLTAGTRVGRDADLPAGTCATFFAAAGATASSLELRTDTEARRAAGEVVTATEAICASDKARRVQVELESKTGGRALLLRRDL